MNVNGLFVNGSQRARKINFANHVAAGNIDDHEIVAGYRAQTHRIGGIGFLGPVTVFRSTVQKACFARRAQRSGTSTSPKRSSGANRQFKRRTFQMIDENFQIVRLDKGVFRRVAQRNNQDAAQ